MADDDESNIDVQNASSTGAMQGVAGVSVQKTRQFQDPINYHRGLFALMASFDWDRGKFSENLEDVALRNEGLALLGLPTSLAATFRPDAAQMASLIQELTKGNVEDRGGDYVKSLVKLSRAVSKNRNM
jgi:hypothetical protein